METDTSHPKCAPVIHCMNWYKPVLSDIPIYYGPWASLCHSWFTRVGYWKWNPRTSIVLVLHLSIRLVERPMVSYHIKIGNLKVLKMFFILDYNLNQSKWENSVKFLYKFNEDTHFRKFFLAWYITTYILSEVNQSWINKHSPHYHIENLQLNSTIIVHIITAFNKKLLPCYFTTELIDCQPIHNTFPLI